jgi:hypothetical protein
MEFWPTDNPHCTVSSNVVYVHLPILGILTRSLLRILHFLKANSHNFQWTRSPYSRTCWKLPGTHCNRIFPSYLFCWWGYSWRILNCWWLCQQRWLVFFWFFWMLQLSYFRGVEPWGCIGEFGVWALSPNHVMFIYYCLDLYLCNHWFYILGPQIPIIQIPILSAPPLPSVTPSLHHSMLTLTLKFTQYWCYSNKA